MAGKRAVKNGHVAGIAVIVASVAEHRAREIGRSGFYAGVQHASIVGRCCLIVSHGILHENSKNAFLEQTIGSFAIDIRVSNYWGNRIPDIGKSNRIIRQVTIRSEFEIRIFTHP